MNIKNVMSKAAIVAVSIGLAAVSAHAGPPRESGRDVIGEAGVICGFGSTYAESWGLGSKTPEEIRAFACDLLFKTDGELDTTTRGCKADGDFPTDGNGYVTYSLRNCAKNEAGLERKAASVVLSMDDVVEKGKDQEETAAYYACVYASNADSLELAGKLEFTETDPVTDLIADAESIVEALAYDCADLLE